MRIPCPCCGERDASEFAYLGDASPRRPDPGAPDEAEHVGQYVYQYVYLRDNPAGMHRELWYHAAGCRSWLVVTRNTLTHAVGEVVRAADRPEGR
jgi:heterotetrameric sarcosine oxidase delta subunit